MTFLGMFGIVQNRLLEHLHSRKVEEVDVRVNYLCTRRSEFGRENWYRVKVYEVKRIRDDPSRFPDVVTSIYYPYKLEYLDCTAEALAFDVAEYISQRGIKAKVSVNETRNLSGGLVD